MLHIFSSQSDHTLMRQMYRARTEQFARRLGWEVSVDERGFEIDAYDHLRPLYLIASDERLCHQGSLRLMPTTGDTLLRDVFASHFGDAALVQSPTIWECTRFCTVSGRGQSSGLAQISEVTTWLLLGICELALKSGVQHIVGVFDRRMIAIYKRGGWSPEVLASHGHGRRAVNLGLWEVSQEVAAAMRESLELALDDSIFAHEHPVHKVHKDVVGSGLPKQWAKLQIPIAKSADDR